MVKIKIVYGTGGGNTELVCKKVAEILGKKHEVALHKAKLTKPEDLRGAKLLIFASPTYGHGLLEEYMSKFLKKASALELKETACAVIGLGDRKYDEDYFIESAKLLTDFVKSHGGEPVCSPLMIAKSPLAQLETRITKWAEELSKHMA